MPLFANQSVAEPNDVIDSQLSDNQTIQLPVNLKDTQAASTLAPSRKAMLMATESASNRSKSVSPSISKLGNCHEESETFF